MILFRPLRSRAPRRSSRAPRRRSRGRTESGIDLRAHAPGGKLGEHRVVAARTKLRDRLRIRRPEAALDGGDLGEDHEPLRLEPDSEECRGEILVDHRVDASRRSSAPGDRDAAASDRRRRCPRLRGGLGSSPARRSRAAPAKDDPAPAAPGVLTEHPFALRGAARPRLVVEGADRLGRVREGRVVLVHDDMRQ